MRKLTPVTMMSRVPSGRVTGRISSGSTRGIGGADQGGLPVVEDGILQDRQRFCGELVEQLQLFSVANCEQVAVHLQGVVVDLFCGLQPFQPDPRHQFGVVVILPFWTAIVMGVLVEIVVRVRKAVSPPVWSSLTKMRFCPIRRVRRSPPCVPFR